MKLASLQSATASFRAKFGHELSFGGTLLNGTSKTPGSRLDACERQARRLK
jgi:hypothetical protein